MGPGFHHAGREDPVHMAETGGALLGLPEQEIAAGQRLGLGLQGRGARQAEGKGKREAKGREWGKSGS
jgi:hypothetical protein